MTDHAVLVARLRQRCTATPRCEDKPGYRCLPDEAADAIEQLTRTVAEQAARLRTVEAETIEEQIARLAHRGQVDKAGRPYIEHVERVVARVKGNPDAEAVAWLHDVLEDSPITGEVLGRFVDHPDVLDAVDLLTRTPPYAYGPYIERIADSGDPLALAVKLADLRDHLENPGCPESLRPRYEAAFLRLAGRAHAAREEP
jgi:(p)ppGpp synthase/HD superfamily hydrolase